MYDNASEIYNEYLEIYFNEYKPLSDAQKKDLDNKYDPTDLFHETYDYDIWFENEELADAIQDKKESRVIWHATARRCWRSKTRKTPNRLLTRLPILLVLNKGWKQFI